MGFGSRSLDVVVGAQYGSEAKGHTVQCLAELRRQESMAPPLVIRVAGPNAGHTGYDNSGRAWALRQVPVAAVLGGQADLAIAPGSEVDPPVLLDELARLEEAGLLRGKRVFVSAEATLIEDRHKETEKSTSLVEKIGSTGKGIGSARADRLLRSARRLGDDADLVNQLLNVSHAVIVVGDWDDYLRDHLNPANHAPVIVEGTQGYGLGLHAGHYPYCTSSDARAIDFLAIAGLNPWSFQQELTTVWAVARIYPIRVAGNSGPLLEETTWEDLGLPEEKTTVTQKVRRVGKPDWDLVNKAVEANGRSNTVIALTMVDQIFPEVTGATSLNELSDQALALVSEVEGRTRTEVKLVCTGPNSSVFMD